MTKRKRKPAQKRGARKNSKPKDEHHRRQQYATPSTAEPQASRASLENQNTLEGKSLPENQTIAATPRRIQRRPLKRFTFFTKLPLELQTRIWVYAIPQNSRAIEILWNPDSGKYYTDVKQPAILQVCKESRHQAQKVFDRLEFRPGLPFTCFDHVEPSLSPNMFRTRGITSEKSFGTFINYSKDTICLSGYHICEPLARAQFLCYLSHNPQATTKLEVIALDALLLLPQRSPAVAAFGYPDYVGIRNLCLSLLANMKKLRHIRMVYSHVPCAFDCPSHCFGRDSRHQKLAWFDTFPRPYDRAQQGAFDLAKRNLYHVFQWHGQYYDRQVGNPNMSSVDLIREAPTRYRSGPYGKPRKTWAL